jgi:hypothetical protein
MPLFANLDMREVENAVLAAFTDAELDQMLFYEFNKGLARWVAQNNFDIQVSKLLQAFLMRGMEREFLDAVYRERPKQAAIKALYAKARLSPNADVQKAGVPVPGAPTIAISAGLESIVRERLPTVDIGVWNEKQSEIMGRVCQVTRSDSPAGTGFLIGPDLVLTNYHVVSKEIDANGDSGELQCRFDYRVLPDGTPSLGTSVKLRGGARTGWAPDYTPYTQDELDGTPQNSTPTAEQLDFAVLRLEREVATEAITPGADPANNARRRGAIPLPAGGGGALAADDPVIIVQHPGGAPLKFALDTSGIIGMNGNGTRLRYRTNTEAGSSGSPCFDFKWNLIALHHYGDPAYGHPKFNQGIPIGVIQARLSARGLL